MRFRADRRVAAAGLALASAGTLALGVRPAPAPAARAGLPDPAVAVWSARRAPAVLGRAFGAVELPARLADALDGNDACFLLAEQGRVILARDVRAPLIPASTQKLLVGAAALHALGPESTFETRVVAARAPAGGRVDRLWLLGGGDPVLNVAEYRGFLEQDPLWRGHPATPLEVLADRVVAAGVREVTGGVVGDASRHTGPRTVPTWRPTYITDHDISYLSALTVNGGWSAWEGGRVTADDPAAQAASELSRLLEARGVTVGAEAGSGQAPAGATRLASVASPPVGDIVEGMVRASDNLIAELLTREIGLKVAGEGTTEAGTAAVLSVLEEAGVDVSGVALNDGSGLDRGNVATCRALASVLDLKNHPGFAPLDSGLAVAGRSGTLHRRLKGTDLEGRLRAKTGSLRDVVGLVGVLEGRGDGRPPLAFAMLANGPFGGFGGVDVQEDVARVLGGYPFPPTDPDALAPRPGRADVPGE